MPIHTPEEPPAHLTRWVLDLGAGRVVEEARLPLPARVPFGVHACWLDRAKLAATEGVNSSK